MTHLVAFSIGPITVYRYGIMYFVGFLLGYVMLWYGQKKQRYHWTDADTIITKDLDWLILAILIGVMLWGRLGEILIYHPAYYFANPAKMIAFWDGGMSFIGWIVWVALSVRIYLRYFSPLKHQPKIDYFSLLDAMIPIVPLWIFFGRIGNFLNQELYGIAVEQLWGLSTGFITTMTKLGVLYRYDGVDNVLRVNTNLLSMIFEWLLLSVVLWMLFFKKVTTNKRSSWQLSLVFLWWYSLVRFFLEYLRQDSQAEFLWIFTRSQWFFVVFFVVAVMWFVYLQRKRIDRS